MGLGLDNLIGGIMDKSCSHEKAFHEAAHAVLAVRYGIEIVGDVLLGLPSEIDKYAKLIEGGCLTIRGGSPDQINLVLLAGWVAESYFKWLSLVNLYRMAGKTTALSLQSIIDKSRPKPETVDMQQYKYVCEDQLLTDVEKVVDIVKENWPWITTVAAKLCDLKTIKHDDVEMIVVLPSDECIGYDFYAKCFQK